MLPQTVPSTAEDLAHLTRSPSLYGCLVAGCLCHGCLHVAHYDLWRDCTICLLYREKPALSCKSPDSNGEIPHVHAVAGRATS